MTDLRQLKKECEPLKVLYVEDERELNDTVSLYLSKFFSVVDSAYDGAEGLEKYNTGVYDLVITDINMPRLTGIEMAKVIKSMNPDQVVIIVSAYTDTNYFMESIHLGISDYIIKPINYEQINSVLYRLAHTIQMREENKRFHEHLYELVEEQTKSITDNYELTIKAMVDMVESRDTYTGGHSERVARYSYLIAKEMNLSDEECANVYRAGMLHDIGKVTTPDAILLKPGKLTKLEFELIKNHVVESYQLLVKIPMYEKLAEIVKSHHEWHDGSGYPSGIKGDEIPLLSKVMILADAFDAMTTNRIYKGRKSLENALVELQANSGRQFDPKLVPFAIKALASVTIDSSISQLPQSHMESERFAYFFHDPVTENYNAAYLNLYLQAIKDTEPHYGCVTFLRNFSEYNKHYGWDKGDALLKTTAEFLANKHPDGILFRIYGDDFVLISKDVLCKKPIENDQPPFLEGTGVSIECHHFLIEDNFMDEVKNLDKR